MENNLQFTITAQDLASQSIAQIQGRFDNFVQSAVGGSKAVGDAQRKLAEESKKLASAQSSARMATFSLSQGIQDLPFGFRGVANNIDFLTQNLVTLSATAGGAGAAMKAIGATLSGPVGILFAISAVTAAVQILNPNLGIAGQKAKEASEGFAEFLSKLESAKDRLILINFKLKLTGEAETIAALKDVEERLKREYEDAQQFTIAVQNDKSGTPEERTDRIKKAWQNQTDALLAYRSAQLSTRDFIKSQMDKEEEEQKKALERNKKYLESVTKQADEAQKQLGKFFIIDPTTGLQVDGEAAKIVDRWTKKIQEQLAAGRPEVAAAMVAAMNQDLVNLKAPKPLEPVKVTPPKIDKDATRTWVNDLTDGLNTLGATAENVNSLIIGSTQSAAAAITDAFFGATKSIADFFRAMVKDIVRLLIEQLVVKGVLGLLGRLIPGIGAVNAGTPVGPEGPSFAKTVAVRNTTEEITNKTVSKTAQTVAENVKNVTRNVTNVREDVRNTPTFSKIERADIRPMQSKSEQTIKHEITVNVNGNPTSIRKALVADQRAATELISRAIFNEKIGR